MASLGRSPLFAALCTPSFLSIKIITIIQNRKMTRPNVLLKHLLVKLRHAQFVNDHVVDITCTVCGTIPAFSGTTHGMRDTDLGIPRRPSLSYIRFIQTFPPPCLYDKVGSTFEILEGLQFGHSMQIFRRNSSQSLTRIYQRPLSDRLVALNSTSCHHTTYCW
jgi:hypothetical protein